MLMSKSRLEKFLYALYSLDSSDLPTPLSRIEELYKCWVTGEEAPTFKPLSRVEKYLMAILGVYDVNELPNPLSRVEVLLYKLATGDDNLDDIDSFLSEHEELLAEIIRNGGAGGNIDIEYVLHTLSSRHNTLYNTAEKPVKSAILKGQTLVNISPFKTQTSVSDGNTYVGKTHYFNKDKTPIKKGKYTISFEVTSSQPTTDCAYWVNLYNNGSTSHNVKVDNTSTYGKFVVVLEVSKETNQIGFFATPNTSDITFVIDSVIVIEGDYTNVDIPYFEGMQSVKMPVLRTTGKNLININTLPIAENQKICEVIDGVVYMKPTREYESTRWVIPVKPDTTYTFSIKGSTGTVQISNFLQNTSPSIDSRIHLDYGSSSATFTTSSHTELTLSIFKPEVVNFEISDIQLEYGAQATEYEPFKSNILTTSEEVELRRIGDVKDELNLITGELTQRIGEVVLDGSDDEKWWHAGQSDTILRFNTTINMMWKTQILCSDIQVDTPNIGRVPYQYEGIANHAENYIYLYLKKEKFENYSDDLSSGDKCEVLKDWLSKNPITIQYQLATESIKTVDLSTVNQDGNDTKLSTFDDLTHVTLSSEGLIPEAELEVATKNEEDLEDSVVYAVHTLSEELNTLYNTAEKPVKSAVLKGQTLVNLLSASNIKASKSYHAIDYVHNLDTTKTYILKYRINQIPELNDVTDSGRLLKFEWYNGSVISGCRDIYNKDITVGRNNFIIINPYNDEVLKTNFSVWIPNYVSGDLDMDVMIIEYQDGMENWDIPYFEGMQSVKMPVLTTSNEDGTKTNILTVNEEVELHGVGEVKDELNLLTGELTERIGGIVFDGSEDGWHVSGTNFRINVPNIKHYQNVKWGQKTIVSNLYPSFEGNETDCYIISEWSDDQLRIHDVNITLEELKAKLAKQPLYVAFLLSQESVKTVDLSVVDQDGNDAKLSTFDDLTHVTLSSEGLIPEAELEVAEKVTEVAASMLTISREQEVINTTINEQSENVDATMIATTEIYEELL